MIKVELNCVNLLYVIRIIKEIDYEDISENAVSSPMDPQVQNFLVTQSIIKGKKNGGRFRQPNEKKR